METPSGAEGPVPGVNPAGLAEQLAKIGRPSDTARSPTGLSLPLPGTRDSRNQFNLAKARADAAAAAAAAAGAASSMSSTYRSRRQSGSSQISFNSRASYRSGSQRKVRRTKKGADLTTGENVQVFDDGGKEVTPKPLVQLKPTVLYDKLSQANAGRVSPTNMEADLSAPAYSRTGYSITSSTGSLTPETVEGEEIDRDDGTMSVKSRSLLATSVGIPEIPKIIQVVKAEVVSPTTQKEKEKIIYVFLHESESFMLLNFRGANYNAAFEGLAATTERNDRYAKLLELKQGSDNYSHSYAQTLVRLLKNKEVQVWAPSMQSTPCQANSWDIHDTISGQKQQEFRDPWAIAQAKKAAELAAQDAAQVPTNLPKLYGLLEGPNAPPSPMASPQPSRRPSTQGGAQFSRRGSVSGQYSRRPSISSKMSRRGSVSAAMSRRVSATASVQVEDLFGKRPGVVGSSVGDGALASDGLQSGRTRVFEGDISKLTNLFKSLQVAERALVQNTYHEKLLAYKDYRPRDPEPPPPEPHPREATEQQPPPKKESVLAPAPAPAPVNVPNPEPQEAPPASPTEVSDQQLHWLWEYKCDFTVDKNVSCMCWNKVNKDLLCVGYGQFDFGTQKGGLVAFWSIKNPGYPLATIGCKSDVTAIDFSTSTPTLLAVGFYNGILAIYDTRNPKDASPVVQSGMNSGRHGDPIWKVQWIDSTSEHGESLVSISTDGRVSQWFLKKDLEFVDLIKLKRVAGSSKGEQAQPFISRRAAGMCFDFCPRDPGAYLVGSEEGRIYKCDRSYSEQYMATYTGHTGPVYQVRWNRFVPNFFLSCSSDWTVRFWREEQESALMVIQTANEPISDVQWSNRNSTVFSTVSADGRLEMWDMGISVMKPTVIHKVEGSKLSCLMFGDDVPVVLTGGSNGGVSVLRLDGFENIDTDAKQRKRFKEALALNINAHL